MATGNYRAPGNGAGTFSDNLVGFQLVDGGGLTQGNFEFSTSIVEKANREFSVGAFSKPISLEDLQLRSLEEAKKVFVKEFSVVPNFDLSEVTNYSLYGSLQKRFSATIQHILNYFPAALEVDGLYYDYSSANTATNISSGGRWVDSGDGGSGPLTLRVPAGQEEIAIELQMGSGPPIRLPSLRFGPQGDGEPGPAA